MSEQKPNSFPEPPEYLSDEASAHWLSLGPSLYRDGFLTYADVDTFAQYCNEFVTWKEAVEHVNTEGAVIWVVSANGHKILKRNPWQTVAAESISKLKGLRKAFGLSPDDRKKLGSGQDDSSGDPLKDLQNR